MRDHVKFKNRTTTQLFAPCSSRFTKMTESGRGVRRKATTERGGKKFKGALAELRALKASGKKRIDSFEVNVEDDVYDEVGEEDYARLVQKRREEGAWCVCVAKSSGISNCEEI